MPDGRNTGESGWRSTGKPISGCETIRAQYSAKLLNGLGNRMTTLFHALIGAALFGLPFALYFCNMTP